MNRALIATVAVLGFLLSATPLVAHQSTSSDPRYPKRPCANPNENNCGEGAKPYDPAEGARQIEELTKRLIDQINENSAGSNKDTVTETEGDVGYSAIPRSEQDYGFELLRRKKWKDAEREFKRLLDRNPRNDQFFHGYADALMGQKRWAESETAYQLAISLRHQKLGDFQKRRSFLELELGGLYSEMNEVRRRQKKPVVPLTERPWERASISANIDGEGPSHRPVGSEEPLQGPRVIDREWLSVSWWERKGTMWMIYVQNLTDHPIRILWGRVYDCAEVGLGCGNTASGFVVQPDRTGTLATIHRSTCTNAFDGKGREIDRCSDQPPTQFKYEYGAHRPR